MFENSKWIKSPENKEEACYDFFRTFAADKPVYTAVLNVTAMGLYCAYINGKKIGNELFTPYFTEYHKRVQYQTYDVTEYIAEDNELSILCAEGWALGNFRAGPKHRYHYVDNISLIFSLEITYKDGSVETIVSDENVSVRNSYIINTSIYDGEIVDKCAEIKLIGNALVDENVKTMIIPQQGEKVTEQEVIKPICFIETPSGEKVIDFGQNLAGYVEISVCGKKGDIVEICHGEILDKDGNFYIDNLRTAKQTCRYILSGEGREVFKPVFSWQGFRYIKIAEYPFDEINLDDFRAVVVHSDMKRTGDFVCGHPKINKLYQNIIWGQKGNFIDIPTDCPQRDERLGWTGDAQVFVRTAAINYDVEKFFTKWLADLAAGQYDDGGVFMLSPTFNLYGPDRIAAGWADAITICPWEIYLAYGNEKLLKNQFDSMKKWVDYVHNVGDEEYLWLSDWQLGDWLALDNEDGSYKGATPNDYISSAYFAYSTSLLIKAGKVLGYDMAEYEYLYDNIVKAFKDRFIYDGLPVSHTQTAYAMALYLDLCTDKQKNADGLAMMIRDNGNKLTTGFLGTPYLLHALSDNGYADVAFDLLLQEEYPSWLYSVNNGATTIWEHWDGVREDGTFWSKDMNSYNHYAYGSVYDWIFGVAAGVKVLQDGAGYKHISLKPHTDRRLGYLKADLMTRQGMLSSTWRYEEDKIRFEFVIPDGTVAELELPDGRRETLCGGEYSYDVMLCLS